VHATGTWLADTYQRGVEPASFALGSAALTTRPWAKTPGVPPRWRRRPSLWRTLANTSAFAWLPSVWY